MLWPIFLLLLVVYTLIARWKNREFHKLRKQLPGPSYYKQVPIFGHAFYLLGDAQDRMKRLKKFGREILEQHNGISSLWLANRFLVVIADPEAAEVVLKTCLDKDDVLNIIRELIGNGSIFSPAKLWRPRRKILVPNFGQKTLDSFVKIYSINSAILTEELKTMAGNGNFPIIEKICKFGMDTVCETIHGLKINSHGTSIHPVPRAFEQFCQLMSSRVVKPWLYPNAIYKWTWVYPKYERAVNTLKEFVSEIIKSKRRDMKLKRNVSVDQEAPKQKSFMDLMVEEGSLSDIELQEEALVLLLAGSDTTSTTGRFLSLLLAKYPEVQEKVYQEIKDVVGDTDRHIEPSDLPKLKYLNAVIKETLRMYPVGPITVRKVDKNVTLPSGLTLVPGVGVVLHVWAIHRNPKYWGPDPDVFRPERFLEGPVKHPYAFLAFSAGPRYCLGAQFATMALKTMAVHLVRRYRILPSSSPGYNTDDELPTKFEIVMKHVHNFEVQLQLRNKEE